MRTTLYILLLILSMYVGSYAFLSYYGIYRPGCVGMNGIKWWDWSPYGFVDKNYNDRKAVFYFYSPLVFLDYKVWHGHSGYDGPYDPNVNFKGNIIDASRR